MARYTAGRAAKVLDCLFSDDRYGTNTRAAANRLAEFDARSAACDAIETLSPA